MAELPGVVVMAKCDITSPLVHQRICQFMAGRKADVVMRYGMVETLHLAT